MTLSDRDRRRLADLVEEDLRDATIRSASVTVSPSGAIVVEELILRYHGRREVAVCIDRRCDDLILEVHEDRDWRRMSAGKDYVDELAEVRPAARGGNE